GPAAPDQRARQRGPPGRPRDREGLGAAPRPRRAADDRVPRRADVHRALVRPAPHPRAPAVDAAGEHGRGQRPPRGLVPRAPRRLTPARSLRTEAHGPHMSEHTPTGTTDAELLAEVDAELAAERSAAPRAGGRLVGAVLLIGALIGWIAALELQVGKE